MNEKEKELLNLIGDHLTKESAMGRYFREKGVLDESLTSR